MKIYLPCSSWQRWRRDEPSEQRAAVCRGKPAAPVVEMAGSVDRTLVEARLSESNLEVFEYESHSDLTDRRQQIDDVSRF